MVADHRPPAHRSAAALTGAAGTALLPPPALDLLVVAGQQHVRDAPPAVLRRAGVMGVLGQALEGRAIGLLARRMLVAERPRELAHDRVAEHHRGKLPAAEHVPPDRDDV